MNDVEYLNRQLNLIIGFLDVSDEDVYRRIETHDRFDLGQSIGGLYGNEYRNFQNHVTSSALILGFTHFEDFLTKMIARILFKNPKTNKIKITINEFEQLGENYKKVLSERQARRLTFAEKVKLIECTFRDFSTDLIEEILFVNKIRNCLMHNNGHADERLRPKYYNGERIVLSSQEINGYGLMARRFGYELWKKVESMKSQTNKNI